MAPEVPVKFNWHKKNLFPLKLYVAREDLIFCFLTLEALKTKARAI